MSHPETVPVEQVDTLLPCPFCGGEADSSGVVHYSKHHEAWFADGTQVREAFFVNCVKCGVSNIGLIGHQTREKAIAAWNTRIAHAPSEDAETVERVAKAIGDSHGLVSDGHYRLAARAAIRAMQKERGMADSLEDRITRLERAVFGTPKCEPILDLGKLTQPPSVTCAMCGIKFEGAWGYVCPRSECPTQMRIA